MLMVSTYVAPSSIQGMGLFAGQEIKKGELIWKYLPGFDRTFEVDEVEMMPELVKDFIETYAVLSTESGLYVLGNDNVRFANHSSDANTIAGKLEGEVELVCWAARDIKKGEEITADYRTIDKENTDNLSKYLES